MLKKINHFNVIAVISAGLLSGCLQSSGSEADAASQAASEDVAESAIVLEEYVPQPHPKTGAAVSFSHEAPGIVAAGENGTITFTVSEMYESGVMTLSARGDDGLTVFGANVSMQKNMQDADSHVWRVDYSADSDGVYYINVLASVEHSEGFKETRATSVRIEIGDWQSAQSKVQPDGSVQVQSDGTMAVILEAEEIIE